MKTSLSLSLSVFISTFSMSAYSYDSVTSDHTIASHQSQVVGSALYVRSTTGSWASTTTDGSNTPCGNQHTVFIPKEANVGYDEVFTSVLTAAAAGKQVFFYGFCDNPSVGHFKATHVNVKY